MPLFGPLLLFPCRGANATYIDELLCPAKTRKDPPPLGRSRMARSFFKSLRKTRPSPDHFEECRPGPSLGTVRTGRSARGERRSPFGRHRGQLGGVPRRWFAARAPAKAQANRPRSRVQPKPCISRTREIFRSAALNAEFSAPTALRGALPAKRDPLLSSRGRAGATQ